MGSAEADLARLQGRLSPTGKRAKHAPTGSAGVLTMACMKEDDSATREALRCGCAHSQPTFREELSRAPQGGGWVRTTVEAG
jgi:hypothetical protein